MPDQAVPHQSGARTRTRNSAIAMVLAISVLIAGIYLAMTRASIVESNIGVASEDFDEYLNSNTDPALVGPGDLITIHVELTEKTFTQGGLWGGRVTSITPVGDVDWSPQDLVTQYPVPSPDAETNNRLCTPHLEFRVPKNDSLYGKTLTFRVEMDITAPVQDFEGDRLAGRFVSKTVSRSVDTQAALKVMGSKELHIAYASMKGQLATYGWISAGLIVVSVVGLIASIRAFWGATAPHRTASFGATTLHKAATRGDVERTKAFISDGHDVNKSSRSGDTPLHLASGRGQPEIMHLLLDADADMESRDGEDRSPLYVAAYSGHREACVLLLDRGADANVRCGSLGESPLHGVFRGFDEGAFTSEATVNEIVRSLLERGADVNIPISTGITPLHSAVLKNLAIVTQQLLGCGANPNAMAQGNMTPLMTAILLGHVTPAKLLLDHGADASVTSPDGQTMTQLAHARGHGEIVRLLKAQDSARPSSP